MTGSPNKSASSRNNSSKSAFCKNNNSKPVSKKNNGNGKVDGFDISGNDIKHAKKLRTLFKSQNLAKSNKKLLKVGI